MSVPQKEMRTCKGCGIVLPVEEFPRKGMDNGVQRYGHYCGKRYNNCYGEQQQLAEQRRKALVPIKQYADVPIHTGIGRGAQFEEGGPLYVSVADVCGFFGVDTHGQAKRLQNDPNYKAGLKIVQDILNNKGKASWFIRADLVTGWLHLINPNKVREDRRDGLIAYRDVCAKVLHDYMTGDTTAPPSPRQASLWQPTERNMRSVVREEVDAALKEHEQRIKSITIETEKILDRPVDGRVYIAEAPQRYVALSDNIRVLRNLDKGWHYLYISQSARNEDERIAEYKKKLPAGAPVPTIRKVILSDQRRKLEAALHKNLPDGVWRVPGKKDEFMVSPDMYTRLMELPSYIASVDIPRLHGWLLRSYIFDVKYD